MCGALFWLVLTIGYVSCQLGGIGGMYGNGMYGGGMYGAGMVGGNPYGMGLGFPGMGMGMGMEMLSNPYGYGGYYNYRCRNPYGIGGVYNPMLGNMIGKRK